MTPDREAELLIAFERHALERIRAALDSGVDPRVPLRGKTPLAWLTEMYTRSPRFAACVALMLDRGAAFDDPRLAAVLLDDADAIGALPRAALGAPVTMVSAFTPLEGATLLHVAAEYGHLAAARALIEAGADVNAAAALDPYGLGGHTPLFHTVNANENFSRPVMELLLAHGARPDVRIAGLTWGRGFEWETTLYDLTPVAYAQCGLLPQMHRKERDIADNVRRLLAAAGREAPPEANVPNRYLHRAG